MSKTKEEVIAQTGKFMRQLDEIMRSDQYKTAAKKGVKYVKIISGGSCWGFVDYQNGDLYKPLSWTGPAKGVRGNVFDENLINNVTWMGPKYIRDM